MHYALPENPAFLSVYELSGQEAILLIAKCLEANLPPDTEKELQVREWLGCTH